ncbi:MAG: type I restriction-modification system endonuclease, partial [Candidatus Sumerlaeia bacterium]|nr:type I restriction-modification system endonuclease [Candidatus Sumerlaeia bacterium]
MTDFRSNFSQLSVHDEQLVRLGQLAERYLAEDPNTALLKLRQFGELLAQHTAARVGIQIPEKQYELVQQLMEHGIINREVARLFTEVRRVGNSANHSFTGEYSTVLTVLKICWQLSIWFHRTFSDSDYNPEPFFLPEKLSSPVDDLGNLQQRLQQALIEKSNLEKLAQEAETAKSVLEERLHSLIEESRNNSPAQVNALIQSSARASNSIELDEASTRKLIDEQLREAGWEADSERLRYSNKTRPERNRNLAIAEYPTSEGPADYVLFMGLLPVAIVEAKKLNHHIPASIQQAKRYSAAFTPTELTNTFGGPWGKYNVPFTFATNGRPYLKQLAEQSGIWFCDLRKPTNQSRAMDGWYTPQGLEELIQRDEEDCHRQLTSEPFRYGFPLRPYQREAIEAVQEALANGQREILIAMATGTGKTKTCIALIYRLLKAKRFRRILFLVDRTALGGQAKDAFDTTRMESLQTFSETFGIQSDDTDSPDSHIRVHITTVQGMVRRVLYASDDQPTPPVDTYDCIVVDECHRGYLLDKEMSEAELEYRNQVDYISKYRRVIEYFDSVKIGLTATPALHTTEIFGPPCYTYSYRDAVIDGFLIDHEPPYLIETELSKEGIVYGKGDEMKYYNPETHQIELFMAPDEVKFEVEDCNKKVLTESFNRTVWRYLA